MDTEEGTVIIPAADVAGLLPMKMCIDVVAKALIGLTVGDYKQVRRAAFTWERVVRRAFLSFLFVSRHLVPHTQISRRTSRTQPLRFGYKLPQDEFSILASMPSFCSDGKQRRYCCQKCITVFPMNRQRNLHSHQGAILLFEANCGTLKAIIDASEVTAIRTAAASAVATRILSAPKSNVLAILGSGAQAVTHLEAMLIVRPSIRTVRIWSRTRSRVRTFISAQRSKYPGLDFVCSETARDAVKDADIICTLTSAKKPVLRNVWVTKSCHINAVGSCTPAMRELDSDIVVRARLYCDEREACLKEPGDVVVPLKEGRIAKTHVIASIGELLVKERSGPMLRCEDEKDAHGSCTRANVTLFKSLGLAVEDLAAAIAIYENAGRTRSKGGLTRIDLNGLGTERGDRA